MLTHTQGCITFFCYFWAEFAGICFRGGGLTLSPIYLLDIIIIPLIRKGWLAPDQNLGYFRSY